MREIVFRGKSSREWKNVKSGQWVNGCLWHHTDKASIIYSDELDDKVWVFPNTVGQFTGLTDKNGKKIFEGDIIKGKLPDLSYMPERTGVVQWGNFGWIIKFDAPEWEFPRVGFCSFGDYEVIGNIHDNPELLGEEMP